MASQLQLRNEKMNLNEASNTVLFRLYVEEGNKEAISIFFQNQTDLFYRVALKYTKNSADAEDVLQSSFIRMINKAEQYKGLYSDDEKLLQTWCLSIVVNSALDRHRSESTRKKNESNYSNANTKPFQEEANMETNSENEVVHKKVQNAIIQLPEKYRIPIHLKYIEGIELEAIATILKLNSNTLRSLIKRGLEKVSAQLKEENVTLSSVGLISLIGSMPVEKAPMGVKSIASKVFETANSSRRMLANSSPKASFFTIKYLSILVIASITVSAGFFSYHQYKTNGSVAIVNQEKPIAKKPIEIRDTNDIWLLMREYQSKITLLMSDFTWNEEYKCLVSPVHKPIMFSMPILPQKKPFVIECVMAPYIQKDGTHSTLFLRGYWVRDKTMLKMEEFLSKDRYTFTKIDIKTQRIYYYENFVCVFIDDKCYQVNKYSQDLTDAVPSIMSKNFMFQKISSRTLDAPPKELLNAIKELTIQKGRIQEDWRIDEKHIDINN
jgi:RNA polymerase sigma-70 factor (ECF subfamily)